MALSRRLPPRSASPPSEWDVADAWRLPSPEQSFDGGDRFDVLAPLRPMPSAVTGGWNSWRLARRGILINDLHAPPSLAYAGLWAPRACLAAIGDEMQNDGPISVLRFFEARELQASPQKPGSSTFDQQWCPGLFRWLLSTIR